MFAPRYFAPKYFNESYFAPVTVVVSQPSGGSAFRYMRDGKEGFEQEDEEMIIILATFMELIE
jgi:hypothetical protein